MKEKLTLYYGILRQQLGILLISYRSVFIFNYRLLDYRARCMYLFRNLDNLALMRIIETLDTNQIQLDPEYILVHAFYADKKKSFY